MDDDERIAESARRRAAQYARQPSLWPAPNPAVPQPERARQRGRMVRTALTAAVLLGGPPWLLWHFSGDPVAAASSWWATSAFSTDTTSTPAAGLQVALIWAGWLAWAVLATLLAGSLAGVLGVRRLPRWRLPMPMHRLVFGLTGTATVALVTTPAPVAAAISPAVQTSPLPGHDQRTLTAQGHLAATTTPVAPDIAMSADTRPGGALVIVAVQDARYDHRVRTGDTLSKVARVWLGDADRWPDICQLNKHRHFPGGRTLSDCDLIYPGWELRLPADAVPPPDATPRRPRTPPRPTGPAERHQPEQSNPPAASPAPTYGSPDAAPSSPAAAPPEADSPDEADDERRRSGDDLFLPGGSIIPSALAVAIAATGTLVWMQRRRRYQPTTSNDDLHDLPAPVLAAQHHTRHATTPSPAESAHAPQLPTGGVGLIGPGADAAARGMIITALTAGTPTDPAQRAEVIIDHPTLTALLGDTPISGWPRLHITDTLDQALTLLDTHLLHRARILDEYSLTDLDTLRNVAPSEEALPPLLLITTTEQATPSNRARITFGLTQDLDVTTVVLGHWPHGRTITVTDHGDARGKPDDADPDITRVAVLDVTTTRDLLTTLQEAHTGNPSSVTAQTPTRPTSSLAVGAATTALAPAVPANTSHGTNTAADTATPSPTPAKRAPLRVLGPPRIDDITADGRPLRAKALELAVFLAVHPDGASTRDIGEYLEPDARISQADQRVHTNASNLRHVLGRAGTADTRNAYVIKSAGRYRLDPATVDVDLWTLRDLMRTATIASGSPRRDLLTAACDLCTAPLAQGKDYEWIQPHCETVRRWATEAHLILADDLLRSDPQAASDLLDKAIGLDRYNEALYTQAMHARHALRDPDGIRTLLRALTKALADLDAEPHEDTITLANQLRNSLDGK
jgi:DNA-binding SARP family transcriptional activator/nucleoid-associated protein YgaU